MFLNLLKNTWVKISVIIIIFGFGFRAGCIYQEIKMNREYTLKEEEKRCEWNKKEYEYQQRLIEQLANIKEQEIIIKIYETGRK